MDGTFDIEETLILFFIMPLFLIVLGASGIGASIALYILRKYDDPNT